MMKEVKEYMNENIFFAHGSEEIIFLKFSLPKPIDSIQSLSK